MRTQENQETTMVAITEQEHLIIQWLRSCGLNEVALALRRSQHVAIGLHLNNDEPDVHYYDLAGSYYTVTELAELLQPVLTEE